MPHVVLSGDLNAELVFDNLDTVFEKTNGGILRTTNHFLDKNKKVILVESLAIEENRKTSFLAMINNREDGVVVRIYPMFDDFEKTEGVKKILAELAKQIMGKTSGIGIGKTNLMEYLEE
jgi:hypothetical protein